MTLNTIIRNCLRLPWSNRTMKSSESSMQKKLQRNDDSDAAERQTAHQLSRALDRAMELGLLEHAERLVRAALRVAEPSSPQLIERIARLRLIQGNPEAALQMIETARAETNSLRLLRIVCQLIVGQRLNAHLELHDWSQHNTCPLEARCLLALMDAEVGCVDDALRTLQKNVRQLDDPQTFSLMSLLAEMSDRRDVAAHWAKRLTNDIHSRDSLPLPRLLVESLDLPVRQDVSISNEDVELLAEELLTNEAVIPALVLAQELEPEPIVGGLLYRAIERALPELGSRDTAIESLARIALVLDDRETALRWIEIALDENRISATLARRIRKLAGDTDASRAPDKLAAKAADSVLGRIETPASDDQHDSDGDATWKRAA